MCGRLKGHTGARPIRSPAWSNPTRPAHCQGRGPSGSCDQEATARARRAPVEGDPMQPRCVPTQRTLGSHRQQEVRTVAAPNEAHPVGGPHQGGPTEDATDGIRRLNRLCWKHGARLIWANLVDITNSGVEEPFSNDRSAIRGSALACSRCRDKNAALLLEQVPASKAGAGTASGAVWNPTSAVGPLPAGYQDRRERGGPKGIVVSLVVLLVASVATVVGLAALPTPKSSVSNASPSRTTGESTYYLDLEAGDCVRNMDAAETGPDVYRVDCTKTHANEIFAVFRPPRQPWPGDRKVDRLAGRACRARFKGYVGVSPSATSLVIRWFYPDRDAWAIDRVVVCVLGNGYTTGSLRNAAR